MPELPEVETVARDLRPRIVGATIVGARCSWARTLRTHTPEAFAEAVAGRTVEAVGRRAKQVVVELSRRRCADDPPQDDRAAVRRARRMRPRIRTSGSCWSSRTVASSGSATSASSARSGCTAATRSTGELIDRGRRRGGLRGDRTRAARPGVHAARLPAAAASAQGPAQAAAARPVVPGRGRQHLRRRGAVDGPAPPAPDRRDPAPARRAPPVRGVRTILAEAIERRGSSIDDYTAPDGDGSMQERLQVYQRTGEPCPRCGRPVKRIVIGARSTHFCSWCQRLPAADRKGAATILRGDDRRAATAAAGAGPSSRGDGALGLTPAEAARRPRRGRGRSGRSAPRPRAGRRRGPSMAGTRQDVVSILRLSGVTREVGTLVILDAIDASIALGDRIGLVGPERRGQDDAAAARRRARRAGSRRGPPETRPDARPAGPGGPLRRRVHGVARPAHGRPDRRGAPRARWPSGWPPSSATAESTERGLRRAPARVRGPRRLHARPAGRHGAERSRVRRATSGRSRRRRCRAASRPGPRWPAWSSPIPTCCCSTSRPTTSTSTRSSGSRSTSAGAPARSSSPPTTGRSSTRP